MERQRGASRDGHGPLRLHTGARRMYPFGEMARMGLLDGVGRLAARPFRKLARASGPFQFKRESLSQGCLGDLISGRRELLEVVASQGCLRGTG